MNITVMRVKVHYFRNFHLRCDGWYSDTSNFVKISIPDIANIIIMIIFVIVLVIIIIILTIIIIIIIIINTFIFIFS